MVKLLRTDTTLDLSQKARVVKNQEGSGKGLYSGAKAHGPLMGRRSCDRLMATVFGNVW